MTVNRLGSFGSNRSTGMRKKVAVDPFGVIGAINVPGVVGRIVLAKTRRSAGSGSWESPRADCYPCSTSSLVLIARRACIDRHPDVEHAPICQLRANSRKRSSCSESTHLPSREELSPGYWCIEREEWIFGWMRFRHASGGHIIAAARL